MRTTDTEDSSNITAKECLKSVSLDVYMRNVWNKTEILQAVDVPWVGTYWTVWHRRLILSWVTWLHDLWRVCEVTHSVSPWKHVTCKAESLHHVCMRTLMKTHQRVFAAVTNMTASRLMDNQPVWPVSTLTQTGEESDRQVRRQTDRWGQGSSCNKMIQVQFADFISAHDLNTTTASAYITIELHLPSSRLAVRQ